MHRYAAVHATLFLGSVIAIGAAAAARALPYDPPDRASLAIGEVAREFEDHYDKRFPARSFGTNLWAAAQYLLFREGRPGVVVGNDGWLFTSEEFRGWPRAQADIDARLAMIESVHDSIAAAGSTLVVALLPSKARVYPEHRGQRAPGAVHQALYRDARAALLARGITVPDLLTALQQCKAMGPVFLRTDTHWTPYGAECAAAEIAIGVAPLRAPDTPLQAFLTEHGAPRPHSGDLTRFLPLAPHFAALLPSPDALTPASTFATATAALLADVPEPATVLIGTSYSADPSWNFDGALKRALREDVLNLAESGLGPFAPMRAYVSAGARPHARIVIWEVPERYLPMPDSALPGNPPTGEST